MDSRSPNKGMYRTGTCAVFKVHGIGMPITIKEPLETCISYKLSEILREFHAETGEPRRAILRGHGLQGEFADVECNMYQKILVKIFVECAIMKGMLPDQRFVQLKDLFQILMSVCYGALQDSGKLLVIHVGFLPS